MRWPASCSASIPASTPSLPDRDRRSQRGNQGPGSAAVRRAAGRVGRRPESARNCSTRSPRPPGSALADAGGVATVDELAQSVLAIMPRRTSADGSPAVDRVAAGLLRIALDRVQALQRAEGERGSSSPAAATAGSSCSPPTRRCSTRPRRSAGPPTTSSPSRPPPASTPVPAARAAGRLLEVWTKAVRSLESRTVGAGHADGCCGWPPRWPRDAALAAAPATFTRGACRPPPRSRLPWPASAPSRLGVHEVHARVRAKFPALAPLPDRPRLDQLIDGPASAWSTTRRNAPTGHAPATSGTLGLDSRPATVVSPVGRAAPVRRRVGAPARRERSGQVVPRHRRGRAPRRPRRGRCSPAGSAPPTWT